MSGPTWGPRGWALVGPKVGGPTWGPRGPKPEIWDPKKIQKINILKIKIRSAQNVGKVFYAGKRRPRPIWGPPGPFFAWAGKIQKLLKFYLFSLVGPWALFTRFGALAAIHPRWGNRYIQIHMQASLLILHAPSANVLGQG